MEKTICTFKGVFGGIYGWGKGYYSVDIYNKWKEFWRTRGKGFFWHYVEAGDSQYLVSVTGSLYLHPMDFEGMLISCGCCRIVRENGVEKKVYFDSELKELNELCKACAEYCGGEFTLYVGEEEEIVVGERKLYEETAE